MISLVATGVLASALIPRLPAWADDLPQEVKEVAAKTLQNERHQKDLEDDTKLGKEVADRVDKEMKLSTSTQFLERVNRIGQELASIANANQVEVLWGDSRLNAFTYTFKVLEGDDVNAFSLPGGFIYIYEGLIKYTETDDELAGVLAHEISHASFRHVATLRREQSKVEAITLPVILISLFSGGEAGTGIAAAGQLVNQAIGSGWSVKAEKSADFGGMQYLLKSTFNPVGEVTFLERLAYEDRTKSQPDWGIYRTHPPNRDRVRELVRQLKEEGVPIKRSQVSTTYRAIQIEELDGSQTIKLAGRKIVTFRGNEANIRAQKAVKTINNLADANPRIYEIELGSDSVILGQGIPIMKLQDADVFAPYQSGQELATDVLKNLKGAIYDLSYRVSGL